MVPFFSRAFENTNLSFEGQNQWQQIRIMYSCFSLLLLFVCVCVYMYVSCRCFQIVRGVIKYRKYFHTETHFTYMKGCWKFLIQTTFQKVWMKIQLSEKGFQHPSYINFILTTCFILFFRNLQISHLFEILRHPPPVWNPNSPWYQLVIKMYHKEINFMTKFNTLDIDNFFSEKCTFCNLDTIFIVYSLG